MALLRGYKFAISPLFLPACRYMPTCSDYALEAIERYGVLRGSLMAAGRLLRCHPFVHGGYDPVPVHFHEEPVCGAVLRRDGRRRPSPHGLRMPEYKSPQSDPGMDKNVLLIFALMAVVIFGAQFLMKKYAPSAPQTSTAKPVQQPIQPGAPSTQSVASQVTSAPAATGPKGPSGKAPAAQQPH